MKQKKCGGKILRWILLFFTAIAAIAKIFIGMDIDEGYIVTMGVRLANGDRIFDTMWELHATSAWPAGLCAAAFAAVTGGTEGLVVYLRIISTALQFLTAWICYHILKKYFSKTGAFLFAAAAANFLPRATQNLEYGWLEMCGILLAAVLLYDALERGGGRETCSLAEVICAAVLFSVAVLSYPTMLIVYFAFLAAILLCADKRKEKIRTAAVFTAVCAVCAAVFFLYLFSYLTVPELLENLTQILNDGMHVSEGRMYSYGTQLLTLLKRVAAFAVLSGIVWLLLRKWAPEKNMILYYLLALPAAAVILGNLTGLRSSGPIGLQVRYLLAAFCGVVWYVVGGRREKKLLWLFLVPGIAVYAGSLLGSNMGFEENASFLYLDFFAALLLAAENREKDQKGMRRIRKICIAAAVCGILFTKGYFVRVTGTGPANITEERVQVTEDVLKGVWLYPEDARSCMEKSKEIKTYSDGTDTVLYLGNDAICNTFTEGDFTTATCISTPVYNDEWTAYYEDAAHPQPTVVFLDKENIKDMDTFFETDFGAYLLQKYHIRQEMIIEEQQFYIIRLT